MSGTLHRAMSYARSLTVQKSKALFSFDHLSRAIDLSDGRDIVVYFRYFPFMFNLPSLPYTTIALTGKETPTRRACSGHSDSCITWLNGYVRYSSRHRRIRFFIRRPCERIARERGPHVVVPLASSRFILTSHAWCGGRGDVVITHILSWCSSAAALSFRSHVVTASPQSLADV